jgi:hypothetical protein
VAAGFTRRSLEPEATVGSVAYQVGYRSPFALSTAFKRVRGIVCSTLRRSNRLTEPEHVALTVSEPCAALAAALAGVVALDVRDSVDRLEAGEVVFLEHHSAGSQISLAAQT